MPKAIGYFREEIPPREDESSLAEQNRAFLQFCKREGLEVGATFSDTNTSGGFRQMLDYLRRNGKGARVVVDTLNRLGLDLSGTARSYFQLGGLGVPVVTLDDPSNTTETLLASWRNRDPSDRPGERVKAAMRRKAIKGEVLGRPAYGYRVGSRKRLEPVAEEAAIVRRIFRLYNQEGLGIRLVARRLNEDGSKTRRGGNWSMVTIRDILRNRVYLGTYARFGVRVPGSHPAIVTSDEHRRAEERMTRRRTGGGKRTVSVFLLSGLVFCGYCGNRMIGVSRRQSWQRQGSDATVQAEYRYYQCESRTNQGVCAYHTRRAVDLEEEVRADVERELRRGQSTAPSDGALPKLEELTHLKTRLRLLDRQREHLLDAGASGGLSATDVRSQSIEIAQEQLSLEETVEELEQRALFGLDDGQRLSQRIALIEKLSVEDWRINNVAERQQLLRQVLRCITVRDDSIELALR